MDRRTYLAFALVIGVLIIHSLFFAPKQQPRQQAPVATDSTQVAPTPTAPTIEAPKPSTVAPRDPYSTLLHDPIAEDELHDIVRVETDLISAEFDPVGAAVRSWKLRDYTDAVEETADLVRTRNLGALWFAIRQGGRVIRTDSTRFRSSVHRSSHQSRVFLSLYSGQNIYRLPPSCQPEHRCPEGQKHTATPNSYRFSELPNRYSQFSQCRL